MRAKKPSQEKVIKTTALRLISGSDDEDFTRILVAQVDASLWVEHSDSEQRARQFNAAITAMKGMKPGDELEGMLSAQLIAIHNATMECCRRDAWQSDLRRSTREPEPGQQTLAHLCSADRGP